MGQRLLGRLVVATVGGMLALAVAAPALATDPVVPLGEDQKGTTATQFPAHVCDRIFQVKGDDEDGWHFVLEPFRLPPRPDEVGFTLSFADTDGNHVEINPDTIGNFPAHLVAVTESDRTWQWRLWLVTPAGWTLVDGSATAPAGKLGTDPRFDLSHTCPGQPPASDEPPPPASEEPPASASGEPSAPESGATGSGLPVTGMGLGGLLIVSGGLLSAGIALVAVRRRRSLSDLLDV